MRELRHFRFWCQKVLPLVYDDSLSYYEVLCKVVTYLNNVITDVNSFVGEFDELKEELAQIQEWIDNFDTTYVEKIIEESLLKMIIVGLTDDGYFIYFIPEGWEDIEFNTTEYDIIVPSYPEYGHLVLSY